MKIKKCEIKCLEKSSNYNNPFAEIKTSQNGSIACLVTR